MNFQKYIILSLFVFSYECMAITRSQKKFKNNLERIREEDLYQRLQSAEAALAQAQEEKSILEKKIARLELAIERELAIQRESACAANLAVCNDLRELLEKLNDFPRSASSFARVDAARKALDIIEQKIAELNSALS